MSAEEEKPDHLTKAYGRASAEDAGRPSDATRNAILDAAKVAARRRQPVANDARYVMRAVAGVAVLGVAVVLWRQMDHRVTGEVASVEAPPAVRLDMPVPEAQSVASPPPTSPPTAKAEPPVVPAAPTASASNTSERQLAQSASAAKDVAQESRADVAAGNAAAGAASGQLKRAESAQRTESLAAAQNDDADTALLSRYFPQQYNSDMPQAVWLVRDAAGRVLQTGEIAAGRSLEDVAPQIKLQLGGREPGVWREQLLLNARGQRIRLLTTTLP